jgi:cytoskeletal protein RodZ
MVKAGEKLQEARLAKGLSLEDVSQSTKIKAKYLEYIEKGEYNKLPSVSYASGFVKNYALFLGLLEKDIMALFRREFDEDTAYKVLPKGFESKDQFPLSGFRIRQTFFIIALVFVAFIAYIIFQYRYAFINPPLQINSPKDRQVITASEIQITGSTDPNSTIYINKSVTTVDNNGNFTKTITVFPGNFVLDVKAINKFGKETEVKRTVEVKAAY